MQYVLDDIVDVEVEVVVSTPVAVEAVVELPILVIRVQQDITNE